MTTRFEDEEFREKHVIVDGDHYVNCQFFDCHIIFGGTIVPVLLNCNFDRCQFQLAGSALQTATWLRMIHLLVGGDAGLKALLDIPTEQ